MKKKQFLKFCFGWMPTGAMMLCTMTMLTAGPLLPQASAAIEQNAKSSQVTGMVTDGQKQPLIGVTITLVGTDVHALTDIDGMFHIDVPSGATPTRYPFQCNRSFEGRSRTIDRSPTLLIPIMPSRDV